MTRAVCVTGGTGTLGRAVVKRFDDWDRYPGSSSIDVTDEEAVRDWFKVIGHIDALVTCAGVSLVKPSLELSGDEWRRVIDVNLTGTFLCVREAVKAGATHIVTIGSIHGCTRSSYAHRAPYTASKAGVMGLTEELAVELAPQGIALNCIGLGHLPALMDGTGAGKALLEAARRRTPTGRLVTPEEVADVVYFLCNGAPLSWTGDTIRLDGGFTLNTWPMR